MQERNLCSQVSKREAALSYNFFTQSAIMQTHLIVMINSWVES